MPAKWTPRQQTLLHSLTAVLHSLPFPSPPTPKRNSFAGREVAGAETINLSSYCRARRKLGLRPLHLYFHPQPGPEPELSRPDPSRASFGLRSFQLWGLRRPADNNRVGSPLFPWWIMRALRSRTGHPSGESPNNSNIGKLEEGRTRSVMGEGRAWAGLDSGSSL